MKLSLTPSIIDRFHDGFDTEYQLVEAIAFNLRTFEQDKSLRKAGLTIEDCLNGRFCDAHEGAVLSMFSDWNDRLGFKCFGF